ncbi:MAG: type VI secretion system baseplate subunit TssE [Gemmatimonadota bacterium]|nr:MAG: type VI secretion system baseplate subunit TssE [Gemmatimonadota bacterium]
MMAKREAERSVQPSLLDRLIDRDPASSVDPQVAWAASVKELKDAVRRDLEWLLNTRRIVHTAPESFSEVSQSLYHYGLPDVSSLSADSPETEVRLMRQVEETIKLFEPRLSNIRVSAAPTDEKGARQIRFLIDALLQMEPSPEQVVFDTVLEISSCKFEVR